MPRLTSNNCRRLIRKRKSSLPTFRKQNVTSSRVKVPSNTSELPMTSKRIIFGRSTQIIKERRHKSAGSSIRSRSKTSLSYSSKQASTGGVWRVSRETGVPIAGTLFTDSLGAPGKDGDTYYSMMQANIKTITQALTK